MSVNLDELLYSFDVRNLSERKLSSDIKAILAELISMMELGGSLSYPASRPEILKIREKFVVPSLCQAIIKNDQNTATEMLILLAKCILCKSIDEDYRKLQYIETQYVKADKATETDDINQSVIDLIMPHLHKGGPRAYYTYILNCMQKNPSQEDYKAGLKALAAPYVKDIQQQKKPEVTKNYLSSSDINNLGNPIEFLKTVSIVTGRFRDIKDAAPLMDAVILASPIKKQEKFPYMTPGDVEVVSQTIKSIRGFISDEDLIGILKTYYPLGISYDNKVSFIREPVFNAHSNISQVYPSDIYNTIIYRSLVKSLSSNMVTNETPGNGYALIALAHLSVERERNSLYD